MNQVKKTAEQFYKEALKSMKWLSLTGNIKFNYLAGINRPINPSQVTKLAKSLEKMLILRPVVIAELSFLNGKKGKYIVDGQHIFNALIRLGWEIPYVTIKVESKQDLIEKIAMLNASSKTWTMQDYVVAWSFLKEDYVKLNHYFQVYDFEITELASILNGGNCGGGGTTRILKSGEFKIINEERNIQLLNNATDMLKVIPRMSRFENRYALKEYIKFVRSTHNYNHKTFIQSLEKNKNKFILATQENGKLAELFQKFAVGKN